MSARDDLAFAITPELDGPGAHQMLDAYRAEVFAEAIAALQGLHDLAPDGRRAPQLAFSIGVLIGARDFPAEEKSSRPSADATPGLAERQARLLDAIRTHGGEWTTRRVLHLSALTDPGVVQRGTARRDLAVLHRAGHLVLVDDPDKRHYALNTRKGGA